MTEPWPRILENKGFYLFHRTKHRPRLKEIIKILGIKKFSITKLKQMDPSSARKNTLSSRYGLNEFPMHTDCAHMEIPPRYIILIGSQSRLARTIIWNPFSIKAPEIANAIFLNIGCGKKYYVRFQDKIDRDLIIRFNPCVLLPQNAAALEVIKHTQNAFGSISIDWKIHSCAIINNWRILHARSRAFKQNAANLFRVMGWVNI